MKNQLIKCVCAVSCFLLVTTAALAQPCLQVVCPTSKVVQCGATWTFDTPAASTCCAAGIVLSDGTVTNVLVQSTGVVSNGACPRVDVTETWTITDGCNDTTNCSQTVTILGCCSTSCLSVTCPTYKQVQCGAPWSFDLPIVSCCCQTNIPGTTSNFVIVPTGLISNGVCPKIDLTQSWTIFDGCGESTNCSQTVEILGCCQSNCLSVQCPTNKTVQCGGTWSFDQPIATTCCQSNIPGTKTNILITPTGIYTNGVCPTVYVTEYWTITDGCGNSTNCSQTVSVLGCCPSNCLVVQCTTNKTVECGTAWTFDPPTATSCCPNQFDPLSGILTNVLITVTSTTTNGVCPKIIIRNWQIIDGCGDTNTCSQKVTVVDTTAPVIHCPTNFIVAPLNANCAVVVPPISVTASDACTPLCSLVYSQNPPAGTIITGGSVNVTVTVTDLCGNTASCSVLVVGQDKTPPVVTCPASMTVTNCIVPCVPVSATDNCCPTRSLTITQFPPCGSYFGPGINTVTVTVTDCHGNSTVKVVHLVAAASISFLSNLTNTGVAPGGALLADGATDPFYALPPSAVPAGMPADYVGASVAVSDSCHPSATGSCGYYASPGCYKYVPWSLAPDPAFGPAASKWIGPDYKSNDCCPAGNYVYTLTFTLPGSLNPATATISGRWAADDAATIKLNGLAVPTSPTATWSWTPFTIPPGSGFVTGLNTLKFTVANAIIFTGLRVEFTNAYSGCAPCVPPVVTWITPPLFLQLGSTATMSATAAGTPSFTYQWFYNNVPINGATNPVLQIPNIGFANAGLYAVIVSNGCGSVQASTQLAVTVPLPWTWGWWSVVLIDRPLAATVGPDLVLGGSDIATNYGINTGTVEDFNLPAPGGQLANVMDINPPADLQIQIPPILPAGASNLPSYTVILDLLQPSSSSGTPSTLFCCNSNIGSSGQDGVALTLDESNFVHITGSSGGAPFDNASSEPLFPDTWNRLALVVDNPSPDGPVTMQAVLNGIPIIIVNPCPCCTVPYNPSTISWPAGSPTVFSPTAGSSNPSAEFYVSDIQFHAAALTDDMLAGIGSPDNGPAPGNPTTVGATPLLSASISNGLVNISWSGAPYLLQETTDLSSGAWENSDLPFTETQDGGMVQTVATVAPQSPQPAEFYRLVFRP